SDEFDNAANETEILGPMPGLEEYESHRRQMHAPKDVPLELASLYEVPLLSREQERHLFRAMNFLKFKAKKLRDRLMPDGHLDPTRIRTQDLDKIESLQE